MIAGRCQLLFKICQNVVFDRSDKHPSGKRLTSYEELLKMNSEFDQRQGR